MKTARLLSGEQVPVLGMGTWMLGERDNRRSAEIAALQHGIDLGMTLIDTAEMYGDGASEELVGEAIRGRRDQVFLVSKVYPFNANQPAMTKACENSLKRLDVDCLDLYLLHWRGDIPLTETIATFEQLQAAGKIRHWGVSNFDSDDMEELFAIPGGKRCSVNQVLYNLSRRGIEWNLRPWCAKHEVPVMAYSPLEQARLLKHPQLDTLAHECGATPAQLALAWLLRQDGLIAIPKASGPQHVAENYKALTLALNKETLSGLDRIFPPPRGPSRLEML